MDNIININTSNQIEKMVTIKASRSRVWRALTDYREFGAWFDVKLDSAFVAGKPCEGQMTHPGYEHVRFRVEVAEIKPEHLFSYRWHPGDCDQEQDRSSEKPTLVEFTLEEIPGGTLLRVVESGFDHIPEHRRAEAFRMNTGGWSYQMQNITRYAEADA